MRSPSEEFYNGKNVFVPSIYGYRGWVSDRLVEISPLGSYFEDSPVPEDLRARIGAKVSEFYDSLEPVTVVSGDSEYRFEVAMLEPDGDAVDFSTSLHVSTYSSSATKTPSNVFDEAVKRVLDPGKRRIYVASPGNGWTSALSSAERRYYKENGSMLRTDDGGLTKALPFVGALGRALQASGITADQLTSDSAGAVLASAYGAVCPEGQVKSVFQNVRTNITDRSIAGLFGRMVIYENIVDGPRYDKRSRDPLKSSNWRQFVPIGLFPKIDSLKATADSSLPMLVASGFALGKGPKHGDPLVRDMRALLKNNPEANVLFTIGGQDPLIERRIIDRRMREIVHKLSVLTSGSVLSVLLEGESHGPQASSPQFLQKIVKATLG